MIEIICYIFIFVGPCAYVLGSMIKETIEEFGK
jgi:hypothetical protein